MADIAKCNGDGCKIKEKCYRYTVESGFWQYWNDFPSLLKADKKGCDYFIPLKKQPIGKRISNEIKKDG